MSTERQKSPLLKLRIEARSSSDTPRLISALEAIAKNHPMIFINTGKENSETVIGGDSELHLDQVVDQIRQQGIAVEIFLPQIAYRETIWRHVKTDYTHKKLIGGKGEFARVILEIGPTLRDEGNSFKSDIAENILPHKFIEGVKRGLDSVLTEGPIIGSPVADVGIILIDAAYHDTDSSLLAFEIAARAALRQAFDSADAVLLEPVMKVAVTSEPQFIGQIISDLHSRRGQVVATIDEAEAITVKALVPLANMLGYQLKLAALSANSATFTMEYSHYQPVLPPTGPDNFRPAMAMRA